LNQEIECTIIIEGEKEIIDDFMEFLKEHNIEHELIFEETVPTEVFIPVLVVLTTETIKLIYDWYKKKSKGKIKLEFQTQNVSIEIESKTLEDLKVKLFEKQ